MVEESRGLISEDMASHDDWESDIPVDLSSSVFLAVAGVRTIRQKTLNCLISKPSSHQKQTETIQQVIHILSTANMLEVDGEYVSKPQNIHCNADAYDDAQYMSQRSELVAKLQMLSLYKSLLARNEKLRRPASAISLPAMIMSCGEREPEIASQTDRRLVIQCPSTFIPYSPVEIFSHMNFTGSSCAAMIKEIPELSRLSRYMERSEDNSE